MPQFQGLKSVLGSSESGKSQRRDTPPAIHANMSAAEREAFILQAIERGVPLSRIEAWLDWLELNQQSAELPEGQISANPSVPPPGTIG